jgi:invasion protein IalB
MPCTRSYLAVVSVVVASATWALSGLAAQADKPAEVATRGQREAKDITYGDWQKLCFKAGGTPTLCRTTITGTFPTGQMAVRIDLIEREGAPTARVQLFVPVGVYLQQPAKLTVDQNPSVRVPYTWCLSNACIAADVAQPAMIKQMETGKTLVLETVDSNLLALTTSVPLAQFAAAHKGAPAKTLEQYVDE